MTRVIFGLLVLASLNMTSSAFAGPEPINGVSASGVSARSIGEPPVRQAFCTQQTQSSLFGWLIRPKEGNVECAPPSVSVTSAPLVLGTGY
jgi:hypothetical protein